MSLHLVEPGGVSAVFHRGDRLRKAVNYVNISVALAALGTFAAPHGVEAAATQFPTYSDVGWSTDGGVPVELDDGAVLYLFGDTVTAGSFTNNSAVIVGGGFVLPLWNGDSLLAGTDDSWFWPADAVQQADGSLLVVANEVRKDSTSWFGFTSFDTDVFVVRDPYSVMSWRLAEHVDAGPWDGLNVSLLSATEAVVRPFGSDTTYLADLTTPGWDRTVLFEGVAGGGTFIPVEHDGVLFGLTWNMTSGHVQMWSNVGSWLVVAEWDAEPGSYGHQLHSVDGRIVYVYSPPGDGYELGRSQAFPVYGVIVLP